MATTFPYINAYNSFSEVLKKIKNAATPERFTQDFLKTKLGIKSSSMRPAISILKKIGFIQEDGTPTDLYRTFRNESKSGQAMADGIRKGYKELFESNEYANELNDKDLKELIIQLTGHDKENRIIPSTVETFKILKTFANFENNETEDEEVGKEIVNLPTPQMTVASSEFTNKINLSYTINLNLPETTNIDVFNAIFESLKTHLLKDGL